MNVILNNWVQLESINLENRRSNVVNGYAKLIFFALLEYFATIMIKLKLLGM